LFDGQDGAGDGFGGVVRNFGSETFFSNVPGRFAGSVVLGGGSNAMCFNDRMDVEGGFNGFFCGIPSRFKSAFDWQLAFDRIRVSIGFDPIPEKRDDILDGRFQL
jgi:hypothetical protein